MKEKIAIIVQRYGKEVNGGAEVHARMIAEKLNNKYDVTILTSRALNYHSWKPVLPAGESFENGIRIIRFDHPAGASNKQLHKLSRKYRGRWLFQKLYRFLNSPAWYLKLFPEADPNNIDEFLWLHFQGPAMTGLVPFLKDNRDIYSAYIFITYQYYPAALGVRAVPEKSILIPTMHDDDLAKLPVFQKVMSAPAVILFNTLSEQRFAEKNFKLGHIKCEIAAVGIDLPGEGINPNVLSRFGITGKYLLYVGRIDPAKGCREMLEYFEKYNEQHPRKYQLVLAGKNMMDDESKSSAVIYTGFISDSDKEELMKHASVLLIPSKYESLSLVLLESFACRVPVLANGACEVLKDHIDLSRGGWVYTGMKDFIKCIDYTDTHPDEILEKGKAGYEYVVKNYTWNKVMDVFDDAIHYVKEKK